MTSPRAARGVSLGELARSGFPVPPGFVVLASASHRFMDEPGIDAEARLREADRGEVWIVGIEK